MLFMNAFMLYMAAAAVPGDSRVDLCKSLAMACQGEMAQHSNMRMRFKVGDRVQANASANGGGWQNGKVLRIWDNGNAYRIELEDAARTNIWAPLDQDKFVRAVAHS